MLFSIKNLKYLSLPKNINYSQFRELRKISREINVETVPTENESQEKKCSQLEGNEYTSTLPSKNNNINNSLKIIPKTSETSLDKCDVANGFEKFAPSFNLAAYLNQSENLQQFYKLGVDFSAIEKRKGLADFVLKLDFEKDVKNHLRFLNDIGVPAESFGEIITKNPLIFKVDLDDLQTRINYLDSKSFQSQQIQRICTNNPFWLMYPTKRIDKRLGYFQNEFKLSGNDIRFLATKTPRLITYHMESIRKNTFCIREEMGFDKYEIKCLLLSKPKLWMMKGNDLIERFDYVHNEMKISHDLILQFAEILTSREYRIRQRHEYLKSLGRAQYDPKKDLYISLKTLVEGNDPEFVENVAKTDMKTYDMFLRTL